jgi:lysophospholipid acyltransferase (LPLAT)-like uncharacterized protein
VVRFAGLCFATSLWALFRTLKLKLLTTEHANPYASNGDNRFLFAVWHDSAVIAAFGGKHARTVALTSRHRDGLFVATVVNFAGVSVVRGSTGASGGRALRELLRVARSRNIVITPDGPRGPSRTMSRGIIFLSSRTGNPIVPTAFACSRCWHIPGNWTSLAVPMPFSRVVLLAGEPIQIPARLCTTQINHFVSLVQSAMDDMDRLAHELIVDNRHSGAPVQAQHAATRQEPVTSLAHNSCAPRN